MPGELFSRHTLFRLALPGGLAVVLAALFLAGVFRHAAVFVAVLSALLLAVGFWYTAFRPTTAAAIVSVLLLGLFLALFPQLFGRPKYLYSDYFFFVLLAFLVVSGFYVYSRLHLRMTWRQVFQRKVAMGAAVVLSFFLLLTFLDSVHFQRPLESSPGAGVAKARVQYSTQIVSVLDRVLHAMHGKDEKSYSAPFATRLYVKESVELPDGRIARRYPRLKYGGRHLEPGRSVAADVVKKTLVAALFGIAAWAVFIALFVSVSAWRQRRAPVAILRELFVHRRGLPWHVAFYTLLAVCILAAFLLYLSHFYHVFGTDKVGQDTLYQALKSVRTGVLIGTLATLIMLPFAFLLGVAAGYLKGWVDDLIQFLYTTLSSIPGVLLIAASVLAMDVYISNHESLFRTSAERGDVKFLALCGILGVTGWIGLCRLLRGEALKIREMDYIEAARAFGLGHLKVIFNHIAPNVMHIIMIIVVLDFSGLVLAEAVLSYIGIGIDPTMNSWGNMINSARLEMAREPVVWWALVAALLFMFALVLAANLFADVVRDAFDPKLRKG